MPARASIRPPLALLALAVSAALIAGCGEEETSEPGGAAAAPTSTPPGRTGEGAGGVSLVEIGEFDQPVYVTQPESEPESLYVVEQCGRIIRTAAEGGEGAVFLDVSELVTCGGEQGLLSVAFDPGYERTGLLYVYYTDVDGTAKLVEYTRDGAPGGGVADPESARELLSIEDFAANHNGGLLLFEEGLLHVGTGDGGGAGDPERTAQDLGRLLGKILRIDPAASGGAPYSIPGANPHADQPGARPEVLVHGLRNPWRYSFDRETGDLWIGDVGQDSLEEIDAATAREVDGLDSGLDFGWSAFEGTERFNEDQEAPGAREPVLEYGRDRGCSVTGGYVVRDRELTSLYGRYLYGDFCEGELRSFSADPSRRAGDDRALGVDVPSLSSFGEDALGRVYAVSLEGPVYRLEADPVTGER